MISKQVGLSHSGLPEKHGQSVTQPRAILLDPNPRLVQPGSSGLLTGFAQNQLADILDTGRAHQPSVAYQEDISQRDRLSAKATDFRFNLLGGFADTGWNGAASAPHPPLDRPDRWV